MKWLSILLVALLSVSKATAQMNSQALAFNPAAGAPRDPADLYGRLFVEVQTSAVFSDSKHFPDLTPRTSVAEVLAAYDAAKPRSASDLRAFVQAQFLPLPSAPT